MFGASQQPHNPFGQAPGLVPQATPSTTAKPKRVAKDWKGCAKAKTLEAALWRYQYQQLFDRLVETLKLRVELLQRDLSNNPEELARQERAQFQSLCMDALNAVALDFPMVHGQDGRENLLTWVRVPTTRALRAELEPYVLQARQQNETVTEAQIDSKVASMLSERRSQLHHEMVEAVRANLQTMDDRDEAIKTLAGHQGRMGVVRQFMDTHANRHGDSLDDMCWEHLTQLQGIIHQIVTVDLAGWKPGTAGQTGAKAHGNAHGNAVGTAQQALQHMRQGGGM